jgi:flagellum-specific ATP synthase
MQAELSDLVRLGAYRPGQDAAADAALAIAPRIEAALQQAPDERSSIAESFTRLRQALEGERT